MLTKLTIRNFKRFSEETIELGNPVVFIGPNDSGKTSALQAIALWEIGLKRWNEKRKDQPAPEKRPGVAINRRDLISIPVRDASHLWKNLAVRNVERGPKGEQKTQNIRIDIIVEGIADGREWTCGLEFDYANDESFYCRPLRLSDARKPQRMHVPREAEGVRIAYLPPMSGLTSNETRLDPGAINVRIGEGRTAEVLRNMCYRIIMDNQEGKNHWESLYNEIEKLFGARLDEPIYIEPRGEITMSYRDRAGVRLDLSCSGRGMQQTMLLLSHLASNPGSVLLLDEPDAHLEILRQRQIYQVLSEWARQYNGQIIAASHSEVVLNEAADRDVVVAFLGKAHRIDDRGSQLLKSLRDIGFEHYYQAELQGWVLYVEGSTDLAILHALAKNLDHPAMSLLESPFVEYVGNQPQKAYAHFYGIREAKGDLVGIALYDRDVTVERKPDLRQHVWRKKEIENYICQPETLMGWAEGFGSRQIGDLFTQSVKDVMQEAISEVEAALETLGKSPWGPDTKVSDEFLEPLFRRFFGQLNLPNVMAKSSYYVLAEFVPQEKIDSEVIEVLDAICETARKANPIT